MGGATGRVLVLLVEIGISAAWVLGSIWLSRVLWREHMLRRVAPTVPPEQRAALRRAVRRTPLLRRRSAPADPYALAVPVTVPPEDGRPGWMVLAPGPARPPGVADAIHGRMDATVPLERGTFMLVYRVGRVGAVLDGFEVLPAQARVELARERTEAPRRVLGPVDLVPTALGDGWRTTSVFEHTGKGLTDTHVDHDGWAYIVGVLSSSHHARAVDVLDRVLATWRWLPLPMRSDAPPW
jgi:hypothetical protein